MTGRDVAVACALGAEEFGFATAPLVALGCLMLRACNLDTCGRWHCHPRPCSAPGFRGKAEFVMAFMTYLAQEVRGDPGLVGPALPWRSWWAAGTCSGWWRRPGAGRLPAAGPGPGPGGEPHPLPPEGPDTPSIWRTRWTTVCCRSPGGEGPGGGGPHLPGPGLWHHAGLGGDPPFRGQPAGGHLPGGLPGEVRTVLRGLPAGGGHPWNSRGMPTTTLGKACPGASSSPILPLTAPQPRGTR